MNNNGDHAAMQYPTWGLTMDLYNLDDFRFRLRWLCLLFRTD